VNIQWGIRCPKCQDVIYSNSRHDCERCLCGAVYIDGGWDYTRYGGDAPDISRFEPVSRHVERKKLPFYFSDEPERAAVLLHNTQVALAKGEL
jgi:hypothetical protein